jgi:hypothetical protein
MKKLLLVFTIAIGLNISILSVNKNEIEVNANRYTTGVDLKSSTIQIDDAFGTYQQIVDKNIYSEMNKYTYDILIEAYGDIDTPVMRVAKETINPCMAFATTWGEAGQSYGGISLTTIMDFNPATYIHEIDWIEVSSNLIQVNDEWYRVNTLDNFNTNEDGYAYKMPNVLLQFPKGSSRETSAMKGLGVGPYQITSSDWDKWKLENRVSPIEGYRDTMLKTGPAWLKADIEPISDLTIYSLMSLSHQGGSLIEYEFGKKLIGIINTPDVQEAFNKIGREIYLELRDKAYNKKVSLSDIDLDKYFFKLEQETGIDFSNYHGGVGNTNKGNYVALHCLRYVFYKNYFTANS